MNPFEMVVLIVVIVSIAGVLKHWRGGRRGYSEQEFGDMMDQMGFGEDYYSKSQLQPHLDRIRKLEERIQVLERIATDKGVNLAREIDNLA